MRRTVQPYPRGGQPLRESSARFGLGDFGELGLIQTRYSFFRSREKTSAIGRVLPDRSCANQELIGLNAHHGKVPLTILGDEHRLGIGVAELGNLIVTVS